MARNLHNARVNVGNVAVGVGHADEAVADDALVVVEMVAAVDVEVAVVGVPADEQVVAEEGLVG